MIDLKNKKILLIDLDGTLIETISGETFPKGLWDTKFKLGTLHQIHNMVEHGSLRHCCIITNQGGVEMGYTRLNIMDTKINYCAAAIQDSCGSKLLTCRANYCATNDKEYVFRKPNPGMVIDYFNWLYQKEGIGEKKAKEWSIMVGDASGLPGQFSDSDKKTAENAGIDYMDINDFLNYNFNNEEEFYLP